LAFHNVFSAREDAQETCFSDSHATRSGQNFASVSGLAAPTATLICIDALDHQLRLSLM
jgi:hypothetical protein